MRFGIKPGVTEFLFIRQEKIDHWNIEKEFLAPVIRTPKGSLGLHVNPQKLKHRMILCKLDKSELQKHPGIYGYITWGEQQRTDTGTYWWGDTEN